MGINKNVWELHPGKRELPRVDKSSNARSRRLSRALDYGLNVLKNRRTFVLSLSFGYLILYAVKTSELSVSSALVNSRSRPGLKASNRYHI